MQPALGDKFLNISSSLLAQNIPNPFNYTTTISYVLPRKYSPAKIIINDENGKALKEVNITGSGKVQIDASSVMASGAYNYSLYINGNLIETKKMVLSR